MAEPELDKVASEYLSGAVDVLKRYMGEKVRTARIMNYNGQNLAYNHARDSANKLGLGANTIGPYFDGVHANITDNSRTNTGSGLLKTAAVAILSGALGVGGAAYLLPMLTPDPQPEPVTQPEPQPHGMGNVGITIE